MQCACDYVLGVVVQPVGVRLCRYNFLQCVSVKYVCTCAEIVRWKVLFVEVSLETLLCGVQ